jgi:sugar O-acyltransferase (sialic acid O-acetyltransferase NeuD family)
MVEELYLLGAGGHASVLADILQEKGENITAIFSPEMGNHRKSLASIHILDDEDVLFSKKTTDFKLINGIGSLPGNSLRSTLFSKFITRGIKFKKVISNHAVISPFAVLGEGVQIMPGAIIQAGAVIGANTIINTGAIIEHDCIIGKDNHIAPGVTLSGEVITGDNVHVGTGAIIIQGIAIGNQTVIAAGAIITKNVGINKIVFGARAKIKNIKDKS